MLDPGLGRRLGLLGLDLVAQERELVVDVACDDDRHENQHGENCEHEQHGLAAVLVPP